MPWIRIDIGIADDPRTWALAADLKKDVGATVGYVTCLLRKLPEHARTGDLSAIPDALLESWALWPGRAGVFAHAFVAHFCENRTVRSWQKHNGAPLKELDEKREHMRQLRDERRAASRTTTAPKGGPNVAPTTENVTPTVGVTNPERYAPTERNVTVPNGTERNGEEEQPLSAARAAKRKRAKEEPAGFGVAWAAYPKRANDNPRDEAMGAYRSRLAEKVDPAVMLAGVERYGRYCDATGKTGTEFVMQARKFFGPGKRYEAEWTIPPRTLTWQEQEDAATEARVAEQQRKLDEDAAWIAERMAKMAEPTPNRADPMIARWNGNGGHP